MTHVSFLKAGQPTSTLLHPDLSFLQQHLCTLLPDGQYVNWRRLRRGEKWQKVPYMPNGQSASVDDASTWSSLAAVAAAYEQRSFSGIGYVLTRDIGVAMIDFDRCIDGATGDIHPTVVEIVRHFGYAENSPSGEGVRVVCLIDPARKPARCIPAGTIYQGVKIEVYFEKKYLTLTGRPVEGCTGVVRDDTEALLALYADVERECRITNPVNTTVQPLLERRTCDDDDEPDMPDEVIIKMARASATHGIQFWTRFRGSCLYDVDENGHPDPSQRDYNLLCSLAWWTRCNATQMFNVFMQSGCVRHKTLSERGRSTYLDATIERVINGCTAWRPWLYENDEREIEDEDENEIEAAETACLQAVS